MTNLFKKIGLCFGYAANNPNETWQEARLKFFSAIRRDDTVTLERIAKKYHDALTWDDGRGPSLFAALHAGSPKTFEKMLDLGVSPSLQRPEYTYLYTPLMAAAGDYDNKAFVDILLARGAKEIDEAIKWSDSNEMKDYLRLRRTEILAAASASAAPAAAAPATAPASAASETRDDLEVLKPAKVQRRAPGNAAS